MKKLSPLLSYAYGGAPNFGDPNNNYESGVAPALQPAQSAPAPQQNNLAALLAQVQSAQGPQQSSRVFGADVSGTLPGQAGYSPEAEMDSTGTKSGEFGFNPSLVNQGNDRAVSASDLMARPRVGQVVMPENAHLGYGNELSPSNRRPRRAFAGGGVIGIDGLTDEQRAKKNAALGNLGMSTAPAPQAPQQAPVVPQQAPKPATPGLLQGAINDIQSRSRKIEEAAGYACGGKVKAHAQGGKIVGPGTATSDSIPAKTSSGEDIRVSTDERIVSAEQDKILQRIAEMLGFPTVDAMFEALTGEPVGPVMKGGLPAAGKGSTEEEAARLARVAEAQRTGNLMATSQPTIGTAATANEYANAVNNGPSVASEMFPNTAAVGREVSQDVGEAMKRRNYANAFGLATRGMLAQGAGLVDDVIGNPIRAALPSVVSAGKGLIGDVQDAPVKNTIAAPAARTTTTNPAARTPAVAPEPVAIPGQAAPPSSALLGRQTTHMENNNIRDFRDVGGGVVAQRGPDGRLLVTNVSTAGITDPARRGIDDDAGAKMNRESSPYADPAKQLERMRALRLYSDATDPTITDPVVRANAQRMLGIQASLAHSAAENKRADNTGALAEFQLEQAKRDSALQNEYLTTTDTNRKKAIEAWFAAKHPSANHESVHTISNGLGEPSTLVHSGPGGKVLWAGSGPDAVKYFNQNNQASAPPKEISKSQYEQLKKSLGVGYDAYAKQYNLVVK